MEKVTIHRALSELKLIGSKIEKQIEEILPSGVVQKGKPVNGVYTQDDFTATTKAKYQSVIDLIDRRNRIKSAIVQANGVTEVTVAGKKMTIADAINTKSVIVLKRRLIESTRKRHNTAKATLEKSNAQIDVNALQLASVALGKQGIKIGDDDVKKVIDPYLESNRYSLIDPIGIEKANEDMEKSISDFEAEVDAVLSEINAVTLIEF
jgi:hypothetical protein